MVLASAVYAKRLRKLLTICSFLVLSPERFGISLWLFATFMVVEEVAIVMRRGKIGGIIVKIRLTNVSPSLSLGVYGWPEIKVFFWIL